MNYDIGNALKWNSTRLEYQNIQLQEKTAPCEVPAKPWEVAGSDMFMINKKTCCAL